MLTYKEITKESFLSDPILKTEFSWAESIL